MKVYIMADIEGVCGICSWEQILVCRMPIGLLHFKDDKPKDVEIYVFKAGSK